MIVRQSDIHDRANFHFAIDCYRTLDNIVHTQNRALGGLIIGVESIDPKTPPLVIVNVPPVISSIVIFPSLALPARSITLRSIWARLIDSALRMTGTINPFGALTAIPDIAIIVVHQFRSVNSRIHRGKCLRFTYCFCKNDMNPRFTPWVSLNLSLYCFRISIIGSISTSLKVVSIAVSCFTATSRSETFSEHAHLSPLSPSKFRCRHHWSSQLQDAKQLQNISFVILPPLPLAGTCEAARPLSFH